MQNFIEYFYPLSFNFNADFQKFDAEIPFTPCYLELWLVLALKSYLDRSKPGSAPGTDISITKIVQSQTECQVLYLG